MYVHAYFSWLHIFSLLQCLAGTGDTYSITSSLSVQVFSSWHLCWRFSKEVTHSRTSSMHTGLSFLCCLPPPRLWCVLPCHRNGTAIDSLQHCAQIYHSDNSSSFCLDSSPLADPVTLATDRVREMPISFVTPWPNKCNCFVYILRSCLHLPYMVTVYRAFLCDNLASAFKQLWMMMMSLMHQRALQNSAIERSFAQMLQWTLLACTTSSGICICIALYPLCWLNLCCLVSTVWDFLVQLFTSLLSESNFRSILWVSMISCAY